VQAALKSLSLDPDPTTLPGDPAEFSLLARMIVGPADGPGEEAFDVTVCTPEWLGNAASGGFYDARHHVVVNFGAFDKQALYSWLARRVQSVRADTWHEIGEHLGRLGHWEFEDYRA
jgi:hypothetical protein